MSVAETIDDDDVLGSVGDRSREREALGVRCNDLGTDPCAGVRDARFRKERVEGDIELARFQNTENRRDRRCPLREQDSDRLLPLAGLLEKRVRDAIRPRVELRIGKSITARLD